MDPVAWRAMGQMATGGGTRAEATETSGEETGAARLARHRGEATGRVHSLIERIHLEAQETAQISTKQKVLEGSFQVSEWKKIGTMEIADQATGEGIPVD